ncbi:sulfatase family protein [Actinomadura rupiterrae]|uniref:sulfatase family protein n=1 Tax=Actinomadura rupiterrae TaxID=559627 RepID=UPI0020A5220F|nr:sulfatase [Actinomadura rupiterrae]MCP2342551.1 arylsulfatase A-like enzyme [Actinomadura rupiterrae]
MRLLAPVVCVSLALTSCGGSSAPGHRAAAAGAVTSAVKKPNVIFVLTDDLATNLLRYMPHVQQLQQHGMTFDNYFVTDSLCCPSRSTTFTGKVPHNTGVFTNGGSDGGYATFNAKGNQNQTYATALSKAGYRTAMMGKYLNGYQPSDPVPPGWNEWDVAGNGYPEFNYALNENGTTVQYGHRPKDYLTDVLSGKGDDFITKSTKAGKPFAMEIATFAPHAPSTPAPRDAASFPGLKAPRGPAFNEADMSDKPAWLKDRPPLGAKQLNEIDTKFRKRVQSVQAVDRMIGRLQDSLKRNGADRDTYLFFTSDNGFHMGEHRLQPGKQTIFDTDIHVPLVVSGPGVRPGSTHHGLAQNTDLCPTFESLGGVPVPPSVDGTSLLPALRGNDSSPRRDAVLIEHHGPNNLPDDPDLQTKASGNPPSYEAIRTAHEVYAEYADGEREYYDLRTDPNELNNTVQQLTPQRLAQLRATLNKLKRCKGANCHA